MSGGFGAPVRDANDTSAGVPSGFIVAIVGAVLLVLIAGFVSVKKRRANNRPGGRNIVASPGDKNEPLYDTLNPRRPTVANTATTAIDDVIPNPTYDAPITYAANSGQHGPTTGRVTDSGNDDAVAKPVYSLADPTVEAAAAAAAIEHVYGMRPARGSVTYDIGSTSRRGSLVYDMGNSEDAIPADDDDDGTPVGRMNTTITSMASIVTNWGDDDTPYDNPRIEQQDSALIPGRVRRESCI